jgi:hypothetical protein
MNYFDTLPVELKFKMLEILIYNEDYYSVLNLREVNRLNKGNSRFIFISKILKGYGGQRTWRT